MKEKQKYSVLLIYIILLAAVGILFFVIPFEKTAAVWTAFVFAEISVVLGCALTNYAFSKKEGLKSKVYGLPILKLSYMYTAAQLIITLLIIIADGVRDVPAWLPAAIGVILTAAVLIGVTMADSARDMIEETDAKIERKIQNVKAFKLDAYALVGACEDEDVKRSLEKFAEKVKYSDPVSDPALEEIEKKLSDTVEEIRQLIDSGNYEDTALKLNAADRLLDERNRQCKAMKH